LAEDLALYLIDHTVVRVSAVRKGETKEMILATAGFVSQDMLTDPFFLAASAESDARNAPDLASRPRLRLTRSEIAIHEFGRHRHHDQSKNPAHHTTGSKLAPRRAVLKFNFDAIHH
jgi:hypothetical protein